MKEIRLEQFLEDAAGLTDLAQHKRLVITRDGQPLAVLIGIANKDAEDLQLERDVDFWQMIEERRRQPTVPLEELERHLHLGNLPLCRYSMVIQWSDTEQAFLASLPEFGEYGKAHGGSYEEAAINGQELLYSLMESHEAAGRPLPEPGKFPSPVSVG